MSFKQFGRDDIFRNIIETNPRYEFKIQNGKIKLNNSDGYAKFGELNIIKEEVVKTPSTPGDLESGVGTTP